MYQIRACNALPGRQSTLELRMMIIDDEYRGSTGATYVSIICGRLRFSRSFESYVSSIEWRLECLDD